MLVGSDLADAIRVGMNFPTPTSNQLVGWGSGVVQHIQTSGLVNNAPGTVTGTAPGSGGPLINGAATNGIISGLSGSAMAPLVVAAAGYPGVSANLQTYCNEIADHINNQGMVTFAPGQITGVCTNTPLSPGTLTGSGTGGTISGLDGNVLANAIHAAVGYPGGVSTPLIQFCTEMVVYIMANAEVRYLGTVVGICPAGGGAVSNGAATAGIIL